MVLVVGDHARLIRWDRGAVVTKKFKWDEEPFLYDFFMRYDTADPETR
jgi:hypothetical protein